MNKERFQVEYNVNLDKVKFTLSHNGLYFTSENVGRFYVIKENDDYKVVDESSNSYYHWAVDLHNLEEKGGEYGNL